ncbi:sugar ABC transporter permease [Rhodobacteraceae bacterium HSP-20]|uniref:Sugar ABC transporter permease n=1 Tax=Paragemmobacter amnigenus TaxID=2852097 RepID=A0ABS6JAR5_9RHOB|nr:sugar ABC transporter permease [Rhodobacter amnigenus]MBU9699974.1 sugar ABC transporter permease [Rhodobacter amnigenus]MBV4391201.1 sugar ABC transporter permease [Rhodobacter amnigenus]
MQPHDNRAWLLLLPALLLLGVVGALPLLAVINYGFHDIFTLSDVQWVGVEWFGDILQSDRFLASLGRSLLFSALALSIQVPLGIMVALLLVGFGRRAIWGLMLCALPLVVPWNMIPMLWLGLVDARTGIVGPWLAAAGFDWKFTAWHTWALILTMDTWHWLGLVVVLAYAGLSAIPPAYRQAAAIDGASRWAIFRHIELPRISGALAIVLLLRFVDSFMIYIEAFTINAGGPDDATRFLTLELGEEIKGFSYGQAAARATLYFLFVLAVVWAFVIATRRTEETA